MERSDPDTPGTELPALAHDRRLLRREMIRSGVRISATTVVLLVLYAVVPVPGSLGGLAVLSLIGGFAAFVGLLAWQVRSIVQAAHPVLRAVEVVAFAIPLLIVVFAFIYLSLSRGNEASFSEKLNHVDALYYTVTTVSTVGFGDITAETNSARILVTLQMLLDLALIAGLVRIVILATRAGLQRQGVRGADWR
jgi:hypothetical protein